MQRLEIADVEIMRLAVQQEIARSEDRPGAGQHFRMKP